MIRVRIFLVWAFMLVVFGGYARAESLLDIPQVSAIAAPAKKDEFKPFTPPDGGFTISIPGTPSVTSKSNTTTYTVGNGPNAAYAIGDTDLSNHHPEALAANPQAAFDFMQRILFSNTKMVLVKQFNFTLRNKYPGRELEINMASKGIMLTRLMLVNNHLYQVAVQGNPAFVHSSNALEFLNSFVVK